MKISLKRLRLLNKIYLEDFSGEISVKEVIELLTFAENGTDRAEEEKKRALVYVQSGEEMKIGDEAFIMKSADCVTNADKIKYDERVSGDRVEILGFDENSHLVLVKIKTAKPGQVHSQSPFQVIDYWLCKAKDFTYKV